MATQKRMTAEHLQIWRDYLETADDVKAILESRLQESSELSLGDYKVLLALNEAPENRLRSSQLAEEINWTRSRLSHHLGRMEKRGLISRAISAEDSRGAEAVITEEGRSAFRRGSVVHLADVQQVFIDAFTEAELKTIAKVSKALQRHLSSFQNS